MREPDDPIPARPVDVAPTVLDYRPAPPPARRGDRRALAVGLFVIAAYLGVAGFVGSWCCGVVLHFRLFDRPYTDGERLIQVAAGIATAGVALVAGAWLLRLSEKPLDATKEDRAGSEDPHGLAVKKSSS